MKVVKKVKIKKEVSIPIKEESLLLEKNDLTIIHEGSEFDVSIDQVIEELLESSIISIIIYGYSINFQLNFTGRLHFEKTNTGFLFSDQSDFIFEFSQKNIQQYLKEYRGRIVKYSFVGRGATIIVTTENRG